MGKRKHKKECSMHDLEPILIEEMGLPLFVLALIYEIERCKNCHVAYDIRRNEIHINAPDPGEEGEEDALKKMDNLSNELDGLNKSNPKNYEVFKRGEDKGTDAIRIFKKMKNESLEDEFIKKMERTITPEIIRMNDDRCLIADITPPKGTTSN